MILLKSESPNRSQSNFPTKTVLSMTSGGKSRAVGELPKLEAAEFPIHLYWYVTILHPILIFSRFLPVPYVPCIGSRFSLVHFRFLLVSIPFV